MVRMMIFLAISAGYDESMRARDVVTDASDLAAAFCHVLRGRNICIWPLRHGKRCSIMRPHLQAGRLDRLRKCGGEPVWLCLLRDLADTAMALLLIADVRHFLVEKLKRSE